LKDEGARASDVQKARGRRRKANSEHGNASITSKSRADCLANLREAIALILEHRREDSLRAIAPDAEQEQVVVG
jgi:hypothetical protein